MTNPPGRPTLYNTAMETKSYVLPQYHADAIALAAQASGQSSSTILRAIITGWIQSGEYDRFMADYS